MALNKKNGCFILVCGLAVLVQACQQPEHKDAQASQQGSTNATEQSASSQDSEQRVALEQADLEQPEQSFPLTIQHQLGKTVIVKPPTIVAALSMNEVDFLDQLQVPIAGMVKDFVPNFLSQYKDDERVQDLGSIVQPNMERVHALHPDLILMTPLQAQNYEELSHIAPTLHFDIDYKNSQSGHIAKIKAHLLTLGKIFQKEALATKKVDAIDEKLAEVKAITQDRNERALVILHNNGAFSNFGVQSRYGFVFSDLGVKPASTVVETSLHGEPISSEFILNADPDILYIIDRTAVMQHQDKIDADSVSNPLLTNTKAWKNGKVIFVNADAWYTTSASPTSIQIIIDDVIRGYQEQPK